MTELRDAGGEAAGSGQAMDSRQVCDILAAVAAEVIAEVQSGRWRPPATLRPAARSGSERARPPAAVRRLGLIADDRRHRAGHL